MLASAFAKWLSFGIRFSRFRRSAPLGAFPGALRFRIAQGSNLLSRGVRVKGGLHPPQSAHDFGAREPPARGRPPEGLPGGGRAPARPRPAPEGGGRPPSGASPLPRERLPSGQPPSPLRRSAPTGRGIANPPNRLTPDPTSGASRAYLSNKEALLRMARAITPMNPVTKTGAIGEPSPV